MYYFCAVEQLRMTITDHIVYYAALHRGPFRRKDLSAWLGEKRIPVGSGLQTQLDRLVASGRLIKTGWGEYRLSDSAKPRLQLALKPETKELAQYLKKRYPLADFCIWDAASVIPFMLHVPNIKMVIVDVERLLEQSFPDAIREKYPNMMVLPNPTKEELSSSGAPGTASFCIHLQQKLRLTPLKDSPYPQRRKCWWIFSLIRNSNSFGEVNSLVYIRKCSPILTYPAAGCSAMRGAVTVKKKYSILLTA